MLTTSPVAIPSSAPGRACSETTASPVATAARTERSSPCCVLSSSIRFDGPQGRPHRPFGIVLVRDRCAEDRHHPVTDELLHVAADALNLVLDAGVVRTQHRAHVLGIGGV